MAESKDDKNSSKDEGRATGKKARSPKTSPAKSAKAPASKGRRKAAPRKTSAARSKDQAGAAAGKAKRPCSASQTKEPKMSDAKVNTETSETPQDDEVEVREVMQRILGFIFFGFLGFAVAYVYLILCILHFVIAAATGEVQKEFQGFIFRLRNWLFEVADYFSLKREAHDLPFPKPGSKFPDA